MDFLKENGFSPSKRILIFDIKQIRALLLCLCFAVTLYFALYFSDVSIRLIILKTLSAVNLMTLAFRIANYLFIQKTFDKKNFLPFHLCGFNVILSVFAIFSGSAMLIDILFGLSPLPALSALILPETDAAKYPRINFRSIEYYFSHTCLIVIPIFAVGFLSATPSITYYPHFLAVLFVMLVIASVFNKFTGGNYMYIARSPGNTPLEVVESKLGRSAYRVFMFIVFNLSYCIMHIVYYICVPI